MSSAFTTSSFFGKQPKEKRNDLVNDDLPRATSGTLDTPDEPGDPSGADSSGDVSHGEWVKKP
jgi:hypothetical protein